jgi:tRNA G18 (ribose-2'-O)-methylase SpoU
MKLNAQQLRQLKNPEKLPKIKRWPVYFILENIYDTYNVGGLFRLADALAIEKIYLCGETETPPNPKIKKASIGTYKIVAWEYKKTAKEAIEEIRRRVAVKKTNQVSIYAVEQHPNSIPYHQADYQLPIALIFGNETYGILPETLKLADQIVEIPMFGINKSLNVIVSAAIIGYHIAITLRF